MKAFHPITGARTAVLALVLAGVISAPASAAISSLTLNDSAQLSPGRLHATLTGTITCDPSDASPFFPSLTGQIAQSKGGSGYGYVKPTCDGTPQPFSIDVSAGNGLGGARPFTAGKASAQVSMSSCDRVTFVCSSTYTDKIIRLTK